MSLVGSTAPSVPLRIFHDGRAEAITLDDYRGRWVVLFFYPLSFTSVCGSEVQAFQQKLAEFRALDTEVIGGSVDSTPTQMAWMRDEVGALDYPLFSDMTHEAARAYGVFDEEMGAARRATFIINPEGEVVYELVHQLRIGRSTGETLRVLHALQSGAACPVDWVPQDGRDG